MAREGASIDAIAAYLGKVEVEWMGGLRANTERNRAVAVKALGKFGRLA
jgi:hypothetical protein